METSGTDLFVATFRVLSADEQEEAFERISELRLHRLAGAESDSERFVRSLQRVAEHVGHVPSVDDYKQGSQELIDAGEGIETFARVYGHYGAWPRAKEALSLSATTTTRRIEARFRSRRIGKVWRFTEDALRDTLMNCAGHYGRPMTVAEFEHWRERQLQLARAEGNDTLYLPSSSPYRRRWGTWEYALQHFGYTLEETSQRFQPPYNPNKPETEPYLPEGLPVAELGDVGTGSELPLDPDQVQRVRAAYAQLPKRTRYVLTVRLGLGNVESLTLREAAGPLTVHLARVQQLHLQAVDELARAAAGEGAQPEEVAAVRDATVSAVRLLARV